MGESTHDDKIIDLQEYSERRERESFEENSFFSVSGGEGERSRIALPVWRTIQILKGDRGGIVFLDRDREALGSLHTSFVLDLGREEARLDFDAAVVAELLDGPLHHLAYNPNEGTVALSLGDYDGKRWFLAIAGVAEDVPESLTDLDRRTLFFMAGECAGLLFHRELAEDQDPD